LRESQEGRGAQFDNLTFIIIAKLSLLFTLLILIGKLANFPKFTSKKSEELLRVCKV